MCARGVNKNEIQFCHVNIIVRMESLITLMGSYLYIQVKSEEALPVYQACVIMDIVVSDENLHTAVEFYLNL